MKKNICIQEILSHLNTRDSQKLRPINIAFLRNITIEGIAPYISYYLDTLGYNPNYFYSSYNNVPQETLLNDTKFREFDADVTVIALQLESLSPKIWWQFPQLTNQKIDEETDFILNNFKQIILTIKDVNPNTAIYIHNFPVPISPNFGLLDSQSPIKQINTIRKLNIALVTLIEHWDGVHLIDLDLLQSHIGQQDFIDPRYWYIGKAPFAAAAYDAIASEYKKHYRSTLGLTKKCLVLDLDNTLWGGIIGEDGLGNIKLGHDYPGSAFRDLQKIFLNLYHRGVILTICSKNNLEDALDVFENHPEMILRKEHFVVIKANWQNKSDNIKDIAKELNIGLDSMVFIDDSDFEINLIRSTLPQVETVQLKGDPIHFAEKISSLDFFDALSSTDEDKNRSAMYQAQLSRDNSKGTSKNLSSYYHSLNIQAQIKKADNFAIPRIAQLTQRSNQFNLTTQRYTEKDIQNMLNSGLYDIFYLTMKDRFGEHGIVGVAVSEYTQDTMTIDSLLVSCRVIGYNAGTILLDHLIKIAASKNKKHIIGRYIETKKNKQVAEFYSKHNFDCVNNNQDSSASFQYTVSEKYDILPDYIEINN